MNGALAEQAVAFVGGGSPSPEAAARSVGMIRSLVAELKTMPDDCGIVWSQDLFLSGGPFSPEKGEVEHTYPDGSRLEATICTDPPPIPFPGWKPYEILVILYVTPGGNPAGKRQITYCLDHEGLQVTCRDNPAYGMLVASIAEAAARMVTTMTEQQLEQHLDVALTEADLTEAGLDPAADPDVERLRETSPEYRRGSAEMRSARAAEKLSQDMGEPRDKPAGPLELAKLGELLHSL